MYVPALQGKVLVVITGTIRNVSTGDAGMYVPALQGKVLVVVITGTIRNVSTGDAGLELLWINWFSSPGDDVEKMNSPINGEVSNTWTFKQ